MNHEAAGQFRFMIGDREMWVTRGAVVTHGAGTDLRIVTDQEPIAYEKRCFRRLCDQLPQSFVAVGPHRTDYACSVDPVFRQLTEAGMSRPDAWVFEVAGNDLTLRMMAEFKCLRSGYSKEIRKKVMMFSRVTRTVRQLNGHFLELFRDSGGVFRHAETLTVPPDDQIQLLFLCPFDGPVVNFDPGITEFPVIFSNVPRIRRNDLS